MFAFDNKTGRFRLSNRCQLAVDTQPIRKFVRIAETLKSADFTCANSVYTPVGTVDKTDQVSIDRVYGREHTERVIQCATEDYQDEFGSE